MSDQDTHFTAKVVWQWTYDHEMHWQHYALYHPKTQSDRAKKWTCEDKLLYHLREDFLQGLGTIHQNAVYT